MYDRKELDDHVCQCTQGTFVIFTDKMSIFDNDIKFGMNKIFLFSVQPCAVRVMH